MPFIHRSNKDPNHRFKNMKHNVYRRILLYLLVSINTNNAHLNLVDSTNTVSLFGFENLCLFKKYTSYAKGQEVWFQDCTDSSHANQNKAGKYHWEYDSVSGLITSIGSRIKNSGNPFCLKINSVSRIWLQRVKIDRCDESNELQRFNYRGIRIN